MSKEITIQDFIEACKREKRMYDCVCQKCGEKFKHEKENCPICFNCAITELMSEEIESEKKKEGFVFR